jgi:hypothetical protein
MAKKLILISSIIIIVLVILGIYFLVSNGSDTPSTNSESESEFIISSDIGDFQHSGSNDLTREDGGKYYKAIYDGGSSWAEVHVFDSDESARDYIDTYYNRYPTETIQGVNVYKDIAYNSRIRGWAFGNKVIRIQDSTSSNNDLFNSYLTKYS